MAQSIEGTVRAPNEKKNFSRNVPESRKNASFKRLIKSKNCPIHRATFAPLNSSSKFWNKTHQYNGGKAVPNSMKPPRFYENEILEQ